MQDNPELAIRLPRQNKRQANDIQLGSLIWFNDELDDVFWEQQSGFAIVAFTDIVMTKLYFINSMTYQNYHTFDILQASNIEVVG